MKTCEGGTCNVAWGALKVSPCRSAAWFRFRNRSPRCAAACRGICSGLHGSASLCTHARKGFDTDVSAFPSNASRHADCSMLQFVALSEIGISVYLRGRDLEG